MLNRFIIPCLLFSLFFTSYNKTKEVTVAEKKAERAARRKANKPSVRKLRKNTRAFKSKFRSQKKKPVMPHQEKRLQHMNEQELKDMLAYGKATQDKDLVFKVFHHLISSSSSQDTIKNHMLDLADFCFDIQDYEKASFRYDQFFMLFPGSVEAEYSQYKGILCAFYLCLAPERDQSETHKTLSQIALFLQTAKNKTFIDEVKTIHKQCRQLLFEHEAHVFEHYIQQGKHKSAQMRFDYIKEHFTDISQIDLYLVYLEKMLKLIENPDTKPYFIDFNLKDALPQKKTSHQIRKEKAVRKVSAFFLA